MEVFHTDGDPPSHGSSIRAAMGSTMKTRPALTKMVRANRREWPSPRRVTARQPAVTDVCGILAILDLAWVIFQPMGATLKVDL